jgi:hypothetical protein
LARTQHNLSVPVAFLLRVAGIMRRSRHKRPIVFTLQDIMQ